MHTLNPISFFHAYIQGFVYLRFLKTQAAEAAHRALHGRWYGGRQIVAEYQFLQVYTSHFKLQQK